MHCIEVIISKNVAAAGREAGHAEAECNEPKRRAIFNAHFAETARETCSALVSDLDRAFLTAFHKGESDG